ncbi:MAG: hypothetical protein UE295_01560 [Acutalibacteraceae bacterium]|nr:hypothetical protein [Acutalibacteraceae bacterium]
MNNQFDPNNQYNQNNQNFQNTQYNQYDPNNQYQQQNQFNPNNQYQQQNQYNTNNQYNPNGQKQGFDFDAFLAKAKKFLTDTPVDREVYDPQDIAQNKTLTIVSYLGILCWIPYVVKPNSRFVRFHVNQGLIILISALAAGVATGIVSAILCIIPILGSIVSTIVSAAVSLAALTAFILGIYNVVNGRANEIPIIGKYRIIKTTPNAVPNNYGNMPPQNGYNNPPQPNGFNNMPPQNGFNNAPQQNGFDVNSYNSTVPQPTGFDTNSYNSTAPQQTDFSASAYNSTTPQQSTGFDVEAYSSGAVNEGFGTNNDQNFGI